jgi:hypothetical protein
MIPLQTNTTQHYKHVNVYHYVLIKQMCSIITTFDFYAINLLHYLSKKKNLLHYYTVSLHVQKTYFNISVIPIFNIIM